MFMNINIYKSLGSTLSDFLLIRLHDQKTLATLSINLSKI